MRPLARFARTHRDAVILCGLLLLTIGVYASTIGNRFIWYADDAARSVTWTNLTAFGSLPAAVTYAFDHQIGGTDPASYHLTNLALHLVNVVLVFLVVRALTSRVFLAHFCAVAFAIHPVNVDAVASVATRSGLLATLFVLASLLAYLRYRARARWWVLAPAVVFFALAALSSPLAAVLPLLLVLVDSFQRRPYLAPAAAATSAGGRWRFTEGRRVLWGAVLDKLPFAAISVAIAVLPLRFRNSALSPAGYEWYDRVLVACGALVTYVVKLFAPIHLAMAYAYPAKSGGSLPWWVYLTPVILAGIAYGLFRLRSVERIVLFGACFFVVTVLPSQLAGFTDGYTANHHAYLPYVGLFLVVGHFASVLLEQRSATRTGQGARTTQGQDIRVQATVTGLLVGFVLVFSILAVFRGTTWHDTTRITSASIDTEPRVASAYAGRGIAEYKANDYPNARRDFEKVLELDPGSAIGYLYIGRIKHAGGDYSGAVQEYDRAIALQPDFAEAYADRGKARNAQADSVGALHDFSWAIGLDANLADAYHQRGILEIQVGSEKAAVSDFDRVLELMPDYADAYYYRGVALGRMNDMAGACADLHKAEGLGQAKATETLAQSCNK